MLYEVITVELARAHVQRAGVADLVEIRQGDVLNADIHEATVVTLFLFAELNLKLRPRLQAQLQPGARVVSQRFDMGDWTPDAQDRITSYNVCYTKLLRPSLS